MFCEVSPPYDIPHARVGVPTPTSRHAVTRPPVLHRESSLGLTPTDCIFRATRYDSLMSRPQRAYISVVQWPSGAYEDEAAALLETALGIDAYQATMRVRQGAPGIVGRVSAAEATAVIDSLREHGAIAFAASESDFASLGRPARVKRISSLDGAWCVLQTWGGDFFSISVRDVFVMIRGSPSVFERRTERGPATGRQIAMGYMLYGVSGGLLAAERGDKRISKKTSLSEMLDLHLRTGAWLRLDGDKFSFDILGASRGLADRPNMDQLLERLAAAAPRAIVDANFARFKCPREFIRTWVRSFSADATTVTSNAGAFDFYSAWTCLMYRAVSPDWKSDGANPHKA